MYVLAHLFHVKVNKIYLGSIYCGCININIKDAMLAEIKICRHDTLARQTLVHNRNPFGLNCFIPEHSINLLYSMKTQSFQT